jgi:hypothetical protein
MLIFIKPPVTYNSDGPNGPVKIILLVQIMLMKYIPIQK